MSTDAPDDGRRLEPRTESSMPGPREARARRDPTWALRFLLGILLSLGAWALLTTTARADQTYSDPTAAPTVAADPPTMRGTPHADRNHAGRASSPDETDAATDAGADQSVVEDDASDPVVEPTDDTAAPQPSGEESEPSTGHGRPGPKSEEPAPEPTEEPTSPDDGTAPPADSDDGGTVEADEPSTETPTDEEAVLEPTTGDETDDVRRPRRERTEDDSTCEPEEGTSSGSTTCSAEESPDLVPDADEGAAESDPESTTDPAVVDPLLEPAEAEAEAEAAVEVAVEVPESAEDLLAPATCTAPLPVPSVASVTDLLAPFVCDAVEPAEEPAGVAPTVETPVSCWTDLAGIRYPTTVFGGGSGTAAAPALVAQADRSNRTPAASPPASDAPVLIDRSGPMPGSGGHQPAAPTPALPPPPVASGGAGGCGAAGQKKDDVHGGSLDAAAVIPAGPVAPPRRRSPHPGPPGRPRLPTRLAPPGARLPSAHQLASSLIRPTTVPPSGVVPTGPAARPLRRSSLRPVRGHPP